MCRGPDTPEGSPRDINTVFLYSIGMSLPLPRTDVWWADQVASAAQPVIPTGWATLDAALPGGGWPLGTMIECAVPSAHALPWRLWQPALRAAAAQGPVVLIGLPLLPHAGVWAAHGITPERLLRLAPENDTQALWAAEQVLRCPDVAVCWVHWQRPTGAAMRRLQLAATASRRDATRPGAWPAPLVLASLDVARALATSAATLRLELQGSDIDGVTLHIRKRRGPPLSGPLRLRAPLPLQRLCPTTGDDTDAPDTPVVRVPERLRLVGT